MRTRTRPFLGSAVSELIIPQTKSPESALMREHQKQDVVPYMQELVKAAQEVLRGLSYPETAELQVVVTAKIHYGFPDHPEITSPNFIVRQMEDFAVPIPIQQSPVRSRLGFGIPNTAGRTQAVYPNFFKHLIWWIENLEGPLHETRCLVHRPNPFSRPLPQITATIGGTA